MSEVLGSVDPLASPSVSSPTLANEPATPSEVTREELLRALENMNAALAAAMNDESRDFFLRKIVATQCATVDLIERAGGSIAMVRIVRRSTETLPEDGSQTPLASDGEGFSAGEMPTEPKTNNSPQASGEER